MMMAAVAACSSDNSDRLAPPDCVPGQMTYITDLPLAGGGAAEGSIAIGSHIFVNKLSADDPGELMLFATTTPQDPLVDITFDRLIANGASGSARGAVNLVDLQLDAGNCDGEPADGVLDVAGGGGYSFSLGHLHAGATCDGEVLAGSFAACYQSASE